MDLLGVCVDLHVFLPFLHREQLLKLLSKWVNCTGEVTLVVFFTSHLTRCQLLQKRVDPILKGLHCLGKQTGSHKSWLPWQKWWKKGAGKTNTPSLQWHHARHDYFMNVTVINTCVALTLLHSKRPKLHRVLAFLSAIGLTMFCNIILQFFVKILEE